MAKQRLNPQQSRSTPTVYYAANPSDTTNETQDSSGAFVTWAAGAQTFTTAKKTNIKITGGGQARNTGSGTAASCYIRVMLDGVRVGTLSRADTATANAISTVNTFGWALDVPAGNHTVTLQVSRSDAGGGSGQATLRAQTLSVEVYDAE